MKRLLHFLILIVFVSGVTTNAVAQCKAPSIQNFSPVTGFMSTKVVINGSNFDTIPENNFVYFGATRARVTAATESRLEVRVPTGATYAPITVKNTCGLIGISKLAFNGVFCSSVIDANSFRTVNFTKPVIGGYQMISQDFDGDGKPDLIVVGFTANNVSVLRNTSTPGNISFGEPLNFSFPSDARSAVAGDFDGDGKIDIAVSGGFGIRILKSNSTLGNISFPTIINAIPSARYQVATGDINGDGKLDLVFTDFSTNVNIARNTTTGGVISFDEPQLVNNIYSTSGIAVNDMDNDGIADIVTSCPNDNKLSMLRNTTVQGGNLITFAAPIHYNSQTYPYRVFVADFDKDGKPDMVTNNHNKPSVSVFRNVSTPGNPAFATRYDMPGLAGTYRVVIGDADGDGYPDIVTKYTGASFFSVFKNTSSGAGNISFGTRVDYPVTAEVSGIVIGDLDGDYVPDIATSGTTTNMLNVYKNANVTVDVVAPMANCKNISIYLNDAGVATITPDDIDNGSGDACGIASMSVSKTTFDCHDLGPNNVQLTVVDRAGNVTTCSAVVTVLGLKPSSAITFCQGGSVTLTAIQGDSYLWSTGETTQTITVAQSGNYTVAVNRNNGCPTINSNIEVKVTTPPTQFNLTGGGAYCLGDSGKHIGLSGSQIGVTYSLKKNGNNVISLDGTGAPLDFGLMAVAGTYTVTASSGTGNCTAVMNGSTSIVINPLPATPVITANGTNIICEGNILELTANNASNYSWSTGATTQKIDISTAGSYSVSTTNINGCKSTSATFAVTSQPKPIVDAGPDFLVCPSTIVQLNAVGTGGTQGATNTYKFCVYDAPGGSEACDFNFQGFCTDQYEKFGSFSSFTKQITAPASLVPTGLQFSVYFTDCGISPITFKVFLNNIQIRTAIFNAHACNCSPELTGSYPFTISATPAQFLSAWSNTGTNTIRIETAGGDMYISAETVTLTGNMSSYQWTPAQSISNTTISNPIVNPSTTTKYTVTYTSPNGCTASDDVMVNIISVPPTIKTKNITIALDANKSASITAFSIDNGSTAACGTLTYSINKSSFNCSNIGTNNVTLTVTDAQGNTSSAIAVVTVTDPNNYCNTPPVAVCKPVTIAASNNCMASVSAIMLDGGSSDVDQDVLSFSISPNGPFAFGTTNVILTVNDGRGGIATCATTVTVIDNTAPVATAPSNKNIHTDNGLPTASNVSLGNPSASDNCGVASVTNNAPSVFPIGTTTITWTITDVHGNITSVQQQVIVTDDQPPVVNGPADLAFNTDPGMPTRSNVSLGNPTASDNDGIATITNNAPLVYPIGTTIVKWIVKDRSGNTTTHDQKVIVTDIEPPVVTNIQNLNLSVAPGSNSVVINLSNPTTTDNDAVVSVSNNAPSSFPIGTTIVEWTVKDISGNTTVVNQVITVSDNQPPVIVPPATITVNTDPGTNNSTHVNLGLLGVSDNDAIRSVNNDAPASYPIGTTIVTWTVTDNSGNISTVQQMVIVLDKEPPVINGPSDLTITTDLGVATASNVNIGNPSVSDNDAVVSIVNDAPLVYHMGINIVKWTATDRYGNTTVGNQTITVLDKEKPLVTNINTITVNTDPGSNNATSVNLGLPTTTDNHTVTFVANNAPSSFPIGTTIVKWTVKDSSGNTTTVDQLVNVLDIESPVIVVPPANITVLTDASKNFASGVQLGSPIATDNSGGTIIKTNDAPAIFPMGITIVTWTITDASGNNIRLQQSVTVLDKEAPSITIPNITLDATAGLCSATPVSLGTPTAFDNDAVASIANDAPATFNVGNTTVKWTATDRSGNAKSVLQIVTVVDRQLPTITAPANISVTPTTVIPVITLGTPVVGDNCGIRSITNNAPASFPLGLTTVTWTVTDVNGNVSTAIQTVNILGQIPIITAPANIEACDDFAGNQKQLTLSISNNLITSVTYKISGATTQLVGTGATVSRNFNIGISTIEWTVLDNYGNTTKKTATVTINPLPTVSINTPGPDAFCTNVTLSANSIATGATYKWMFGALTIGTASTLNLTAANADGTYTVAVTDGKGCKSSTSASYVFNKQNLGNMYTLYAFKSIKLHHNNLVNGSIGVRDERGSLDINRYTTVASPGFVKAAIISVDRTSVVPNRILAPAIITLPTMQYYTGNTLLYNSTTVNQFTTVTLSGNYRDIKINKGANVTLTGTIFRAITIEEGAVVTFTAPVINIEDLNVGRGPNTSYTYVNFATDASVRIGKSVTVQQRSIVNAAAKQVTFYLGDMSPDVENFMVLGGDNKITANIYIPNGKLHVNGGCMDSYECERSNHSYGYHNCQSSANNNVNNSSNDHGNDYPNNICPPTVMTGFFIAESIQSTGKNVIWNGFNCLAAAPATTRQITNTITNSLPEIKTQVVTATIEANDINADRTLKLEVYPVPTRGLFDVRLHNLAYGNAKVEVVTANGVVAEAKSVNVNSKTIVVNFNLTSKAQGNYFIRVIASDGKQVRTTILIAR